LTFPSESIPEANKRALADILRWAEAQLERVQSILGCVQAQRLVDLARITDHPHLIARALLLFGLAVAGDRSQAAAARDAAEEAYDLLGQCRDVARQIMTLQVLARVSGITDGPVSRMQWLHLGLSSAHGSDCTEVRCALLADLAECLVEMEQHSQALVCLGEAVDLLTAAADTARSREWPDTDRVLPGTGIDGRRIDLFRSPSEWGSQPPLASPPIGVRPTLVIRLNALIQSQVHSSSMLSRRTADRIVALDSAERRVYLLDEVNAAIEDVAVGVRLLVKLARVN
jgi:hypothetical protein